MSLKRSLSDSECEDLFSDTKDSCMTPPGSDHHLNNNNACGGHSNRKKRRGIIEKRRRDRINNSLTELRRLVPTAFEKQGSAKLEKAEILQMTVDHLKMLHAKGLDALAYDPHKFAMDYHSIGFRECAAEVARYLVNIEGMDIQDPLRLRLMSHLQCFAAQRELANKQASASTWGLNTFTAAAAVAGSTNTAAPGSYAALPASHHYTGISSSTSASAAGSHHHSSGLMEATSPSQPGSVHLHYQQHGNGNNNNSQQQQSHSNSSSSHYHTSPSMPHESLLNSHHQQQQQQSLYSSPASHHHHHHQGLVGNSGVLVGMGMGVGVNVSGNSSSSTQTYIPNGKFRPWGGAELAY